MLTYRKIIEIDEERCNGCGLCVGGCAEGAIALVDGKARVISDQFCDGLGACLAACPQNALRIVEREAVPFNEEAVQEHLREARHLEPLPMRGSAAKGCPGAAERHFAPGGDGAAHWPVKLRLVSPTASFLRGAGLLLTADCAPAVFPGFHALAQGRVVLTACPKFEDMDSLTRKLSDICASQDIRSLTALRMDVPCCRSLERLAREALRQADVACPLATLCLGCDGRTISA